MSINFPSHQDPDQCCWQPNLQPARQKTEWRLNLPLLSLLLGPSGFHQAPTYIKSKVSVLYSLSSFSCLLFVCMYMLAAGHHDIKPIKLKHQTGFWLAACYITLACKFWHTWTYKFTQESIPFRRDRPWVSLFLLLFGLAWLCLFRMVY